MDKQLFAKADIFLKKRFIKYPHWSYNNWRVMYEHSVNVYNLAIKISETVKCDPVIVGLSALFHDIGKTYKASGAFLEIHAHRLNAVVAKPFLEKSNLSKQKIQKILNIISYKSRSTEYKIMMDADALAFFKEIRFHSLYFNWAMQNKKYSDLERHIKKYENLNFLISKKMGKDWFKKTLKKWKPKFNKIQQLKHLT